ncbi:MAG: DUF2007 domain-containing protein [Candidatus Kapaibacterium sp.]
MKCFMCNNELGEDEIRCGICGHINNDNIAYDKLNWVVVYVTNSVIDAEMFKANLEGADIPAQVLSQVDSTRMFTLGELAKVKIFVPDYLIEDAREIIKAIESGKNIDF